MPHVANDRIAWRVRRSFSTVIVMATTHEFAKSYAAELLGGDPDEYEVDPITRLGEPVTFLLFT